MKQIVKAFFVALIIYALAVPILNLISREYPIIRTTGDGLLVFVIRHIIMFACILIFYARDLRRVFSFIGLRTPFLRPVFAGFICALPFVISWVGGSIFYGVPIGITDKSLLMFVIAILGPGLFEEGVFRGIFFNEASKVTKWYFAALYTGIFFGLAHVANLIIGHNLQEVLISVTAGVIMSFPMGFMFYKMKRNLWACFSFHLFIAGSMDVLISEELIKAHLNDITSIASIGLILSFILVFVLYNIKWFVRFASGDKKE